MHKIRPFWISLLTVFMLIAGCSDSDSPTGPEPGTKYPITDDYICWVHSTESHFTRISGRAADDIFALTRDNVIFHFDGTSWRNTVHFPDITCHAEDYPLWATEDGVLFVGCGETVYRYDGSEWIDMPLSPGVVVAGLWGITSDDVIAVGADGKGHRAASVIFHYNGNEWSSVPHDVTKPLTAVHGTPWGHIFAAGEEGAFVHYDGRNWVTLSAPTRRDFKALWAAGQNLVVAVGDAGTIVHYDGEAFEVMSTGTIWDIRAVWGNGPDDIYAGGEFYTMLHYDGTSWSPMEDPPYAVKALWTTPEGILLAGTTHGGIRMYANATWTTAFAMQKGWLSELWGASHDDVYVSGITNVLHYDGTSWQQATSRPSYDAFYSEGISGTSSSDVWVVWLNGEIQRRYGASWFSVPNYTGATWLEDVWAAAPNDAYAVGESHVIHWDGSIWSTALIHVGYLTAIDGSGPGHAFIVGIHGQILMLNGEQWVQMQAPGNEHLHDVSVVDENTAYVAVDGGGMLVFDGQEWTRMATPAEFSSIWAPAKDEVFGLQYRTGDVYRWNGDQWELVPRALRFPFTGRKIWGHSREGFWVVGYLENSGIIIEYQLAR